jgi:hypothetical protein
MACFVVPVAEAVITTAVSKILSSREKSAQTVRHETGDGANAAEKIPFSRKLGWLSNLLWGGSALLCLSISGTERWYLSSRS